MRRKTIGYKEFNGNIDITDPCYDKDVWCRINNIHIKPGNYKCLVWMNTDKGKCDGEPYVDTHVGIIGIYLDGVIPTQKDFSEIGHIGVDAGLAGFFVNKPDYSDSEWSKFCDSIRDGCAWVIDEGFFSESGYGDGDYGVYVNKTDDIITSVEIRFM
jgi:hypothetical protein